MKRDLLNLLCSPCCKAELKLETKQVLINDATEEDILEGILSCSNCNKRYPIINGIPRLCTELWEEEIRELQRLRNTAYSVIHTKNKERSFNIYEEIEKKVRQKINLPTNASNYLKKKKENDIYFRVRGCEKQDKYIQTLKLYYDKKKVETILDVGGGQGGLIKCFSECYSPYFSIMLDYDLSWIDVAKLRNPTVQVIRGDAVNLPFKKASIDIVISQAMLEHIREYDKAIKEMCEVTKDVCFVSWNPNKFSLYDFGHLDAPVTILPKAMAKYVAIMWHRIRRTGVRTDTIISGLERTFYISTTHVKNILRKYGRVYNVFVDFLLFSIQSNYSYRMRRIRKIFLKHTLITKLICKLFILLRIEPNCYYILKKR